MRRNPHRAETAGWARKASILLLMAATLALFPEGCSNESTTSGPVTIPVKLSVSVSFINPTPGATVNVLNYSPNDPGVNLQAKTDNSGYAEFNTDFNVLLPNHIYKVKVQDIDGLKQANPDQDTVWVPSSPNYPDHYELYRPISMMPK
jgi:hypothetical protein